MMVFIKKVTKLSDNNKASKTILKTNILMFSIFIDLILWSTLSTIFGYLAGDHYFGWRLQNGAIVAFVFATLTTLAMLGLEVYGTSKKHMESMIACIVIRCIRGMNFLCIAVAVGEGYYTYLVAIFIICMLWDLLRFKAGVKMISMIKKENSESAKAVKNLDAEAQLDSDQSMDLSFPKIIKSLLKENNLIKKENNEIPTLTKTAQKFDYDNNIKFESLEPTVSKIIDLVKEENNSTRALIKKENYEDPNTKASINKDNIESANITKKLDNELPILNSIQIQE